MHHKKEIEQALIATILANPQLLGTLPIKGGYFFTGICRKSFEVLKKMQANGEEINLVTFAGRLDDTGYKMSEVSGFFGDNVLWSGVSAESYVLQLSEEFVKRQIVEKYESMANAPREFIEEVKKIEQDFLNYKAKNVGELYDEYVEDYENRKQKIKDGSIGVVTGFDYLDQNCAFEEGNLIILAAKTSVGKTSLALNMAVNSAMFGQKVIFFSAEMTVREVMNRVLSQLTGISSTRFKYCNADEQLKRAKNEILQIKENLKIVECSGMSSSDIALVVRRAGDVDFFVVDYIQYLRDRIKNGNNNDRVGQITRNLKSVAIETKSAVLALSQVNRGTEGVPELKNLRDSGNIEQDADVVLMLSRDGGDRTIADLVIAKNRNGQVGSCELNFQADLTLFTNLEEYCDMVDLKKVK